MKKIFKLIGIIAFAAVIGFSFTACDDENGGGGGGTDNGQNSKLELSSVQALDLATWAGQTATISFKTSADGDYYYVLRRSSTSAPTSEYILKQQLFSYLDAGIGTTTVNKGENTIKISGLTESYEYTAYLLAKNQSNTTDVKTVTFKPAAKIKNWTVVDKSSVLGNSPSFVDAIFAEGKFFAISSSKIFISQNGLDWTSQNIDFSGLSGSSYPQAYGITYGNGILMIGIVGDSYATSVIYSDDGGSTWKKGQKPFGDLTLVDYTPKPSMIKFAGGRFIISLTNPNGGYSDDPSAIYVSHSSDGVTWNYVSKDGYTVANRFNIYDIAYGNGIYIGLTGKGWIVSNDGFETNSWTDKSYTWGSSTSDWNIIFDETANLFIGACGTSRYVFSNDGSSVQYKDLSSSTINSAQSIAKAEGIYVVGTDGFKEIWYSADGNKWYAFKIAILEDSFAKTYPIVYGNGRFIILMRDGKIAYCE